MRCTLPAKPIARQCRVHYSLTSEPRAPVLDLTAALRKACKRAWRCQRLAAATIAPGWTWARLVRLWFELRRSHLTRIDDKDFQTVCYFMIKCKSSRAIQRFTPTHRTPAVVGSCEFNLTLDWYSYGCHASCVYACNLCGVRRRVRVPKRRIFWCAR